MGVGLNLRIWDCLKKNLFVHPLIMNNSYEECRINYNSLNIFMNNR